VPPSGTVLLEQVSPQISASDLSATVIARATGWSTSVTASPPTHAQPGPAHPIVVSTLDNSPADGPVRRIAAGPIGDIPGVKLPHAPTLPHEAAATKVMMQRFRIAATAVANYINDKTAKIADDPTDPPLATALATVQTSAIAALDPAITIVARARARLPLPSAGDPLRPLLVKPVFARAMSETLEPEQLLPGAGDVPTETAALLVTNPNFVEAFMVGLNDEMRREFAWRQYPTDARNTFFARFWGGNSAIDDIPPIAGWDGSKRLGDNATSHGEQLVLLMRGELWRRYPNTIVSAIEATRDASNQRILSTTELFPVFRGSIADDMVFFGFNLAESDAVAGDGWYFVLAEHPTEPRFGAEPTSTAATLTSWNELGWPQIAVTRSHIDLAAPAPSAALENASWAADAAHQAFIQFRRPVRLALHATALLG
jgi:hypothetical protein